MQDNVTRSERNFILPRAIIVLTSFLSALFFVSCRKEELRSYPYYSIENFIGTDIEKLAQNVNQGDTIAINEYMKTHPISSIDTKEKYYGMTLLMWTIINHQHELFRYLLYHGADPNISDDEGNSPLYYACTNTCMDIRYFKELLNKGASPNDDNVIMWALQGRIEYVKLLVEYGADYNKKINGRFSVADWSIILCQPKIAKYLITEKNAVLYNNPDFCMWPDYCANIPDYETDMKYIMTHLSKHPKQIHLR